MIMNKFFARRHATVSCADGISAVAVTALGCRQGGRDGKVLLGHRELKWNCLEPTCFSIAGWILEKTAETGLLPDVNHVLLAMLGDRVAPKVNAYQLAEEVIAMVPALSDAESLEIVMSALVEQVTERALDEPGLAADDAPPSRLSPTLADAITRPTPLRRRAMDRKRARIAREEISKKNRRMMGSDQREEQQQEDGRRSDQREEQRREPLTPAGSAAPLVTPKKEK